MAKNKKGPTPRPKLSGESLEPRILLSATWVGTDADDSHAGTSADELLDAGLGDDLLAGLGGDDVIDGGAGNDTVDYDAADSGVVVDLTLTTAQSIGGGQGSDTLQDIENVRGSQHDDTFRFSEPSDGATYGVDGNGGSNSIDLSGFASSSASFSDGAVQIDLDDGGSFTVEFESIDSFTFADRSMNIVTWDGDAGNSDWSDADNWTTDTAPGADDIVVISSGDPGGLVIGSSDGTTDLGGLVVQSSYGQTITIAGDLDIDGDLVIGSGTLDANDHSINLSGDLVVESGATLREDSATFVFDGAGEQIVRGDDIELHDVEIDKASGTVTLGAKLEISGDFTVAQGSFDQAGHQLEFQGSNTTIDADGVAFEDVRFNVSGTTTLAHDMNVGGDLTIVGARRIDGGALRVAGDVMTHDNNWYGSSEVVLNGTGDQAITTDGSGELHDVTIDKASGAVTLGAKLEISGDFTVAQGSFDQAGHQLEFQGSNTTIDADGVAFEDVRFNVSGTTTLAHDMNVGGDLTIVGARRIDGGALRVAGDVMTHDNNWYGSSEVVLNGTGDQAVTTDGSGELHDVTIDKASGAVTLGAKLEISGDFTVAQGSFDQAGHQLEFQGSNTTIDADGVAFEDVRFNVSGTTTLAHDMNVGGDLTIVGAQRIDGGALRVAGDVMTHDNNWYGSSEVVLNGTGDQAVTTDGSGELHDVTIDKASGAVTLGAKLEISGDFTVAQGSFDQAGHQLEFQGSNTTIDADGVAFEDVRFNVSGTTTLAHDMNVGGDLTIVGAQRIDGGALRVAGDVMTHDNNWYGSSEVVLNGTGDQAVTTDGSGELHDVTIDKASGAVTLGAKLEISGDFTVAQGSFDQAGHQLEFQGSNTTIDADGVAFEDVRFNVSGTTTLAHDMNVGGDLTIVGAQRIDGGALRVAGDVMTHDNNWYGSSEVVLNGTGDQAITTDGSGELHDVTIDKASGAVTLGAKLEISGDFTVAQGSFDQAGHQLEFQGSNTTIDANGARFGDVTLNVSGTTTLASDMIVNGDLTVSRLSTLDGGDIYVLGAIELEDSAWSGASQIHQGLPTDWTGTDADDTFDLGDGATGETYTVSGGAGADTVDLSSYALGDVSLSDGSLTVETPDGTFAIDVDGVESVTMSDGSITIVSGDTTHTDFSGTGMFVDGNDIFEVDVAGAGTVDLEYDATNDVLAVTGSDSTDSTTVLAITDIANAGGFEVGDLSFDGPIGDLTVSGDVGAVTVAGAITGDVSIAGDATDLNIGSVASTGRVAIDGTIDSATIGSVEGEITVGRVEGGVSFSVDGTDHGMDFETPAQLQFDGDGMHVNLLPSAGVDSTVEAGDTVTLGVEVTAPGNWTYEWTQAGGVSAELSDSTSMQPTFEVSDGLTGSNLTFEVMITDGDSHVTTDTVAITVAAEPVEPETVNPESQSVEPETVNPESQSVEPGDPVLEEPTPDTVEPDSSVLADPTPNPEAETEEPVLGEPQPDTATTSEATSPVLVDPATFASQIDTAAGDVDEAAGAARRIDAVPGDGPESAAATRAASASAASSEPAATPAEQPVDPEPAATDPAAAATGPAAGTPSAEIDDVAADARGPGDRGEALAGANPLIEPPAASGDAVTDISRREVGQLDDSTEAQTWYGSVWASLLALVKGSRTGDERDGKG